MDKLPLDMETYHILNVKIVISGFRTEEFYELSYTN